jgi:hypothetical protein
MLTKIGVAALLGTIGTAAVGGVARADEPCRTQVTFGAPAPVVAPIGRPVVVAAPPVVTPVDYRYGYGDGYGYGTPGVYYRHDRREELERMRREQREEARRHAMWLHRYGHRF